MKSHLVTKSQLGGLTQYVSDVRTLLDLHAATPWDGVHGGLYAVDHTYYDSAGDVVAEKVVPVEIDGTAYYVPVRPYVVASGDLDIPAGYPAGDVSSFWKHEEATGANRTDSFGNKTLVQSGGVVSDVGKFGNCSKFLGSQFLTVPAGGTLDLANSFTMTLWVKPSAFTGADQVVFSKSLSADPTHTEFALLIREVTGFYYFNLDFGDGISVETIEDATSVNDGVWYFVAFGYDRSTNKAFLHVVKSGEVMTLSDPVFGAQAMVVDSPDWVFGGYGDHTLPFKGFVDSVRFYRRALLNPELIFIYGGGTGISVQQNPLGVNSDDPVMVREAPESQHLLTQDADFDDLSVSAKSALDTLQAHISTRVPMVHTGIKAIDRKTLDSRNHTAGRNLLVSKYKGRDIGVVADTRIDGPPQLVRFGPPHYACPVAEFAPDHGGGTYSDGYDNNGGCRLHMEADPGQPWPSFMLLTFNLAGGTGPIIFRWEWSTNSTQWIPIGTDGAIVSGAGIRPVQIDASPSHAGVINATPVSFITKWTIKSPGGEGSGKFWIRCKFDNSAIGGGVVYSCVVPVYVKDHASGCWLCTLVRDRGLINEETYLKDRRYSRRNTSHAAKVGYTAWALPLSVQMQKRPWLFRLISPSVVRWTHHMADVEDGKRGNFIGRWMFKLGVPACAAVGKVVLAKRAVERFFQQKSTSKGCCCGSSGCK